MPREILPQVFDNPEFGQLRVIRGDDGEPWFVAKDVCDALGLGRQQDSTRYLDDDEKGECLVNTPSGEQRMVIVSEAGLYSLILRSRKPEARRFKRWVTHDVLLSIRRNGGYMVARPEESDAEVLSRALLIAQRTIERRDAEIADQQAMIGELSPKAAFFDAVGDSDGKMSVADLSKALRQAGIEMGQNRLFKWFRDNGYMGKRGIHRNRPTQRAIEQGLFYLHDTTFVRRDGKVFNSFTPMVTAKGATVFFKAISGQRQMAIEV
jgi:anti-repressor protein